MKHPDNNDPITLCAKCAVPVMADFSRPGKEWRCPSCGRFTELFDHHFNKKWGELTQAQQEVWLAGARG